MKVSAKGNIEKAPVGNHLARSIWVVDLGTQKSEYQGKPNVARKVYIGWELMTENRMADGRRFMIGSQFTASLGKKARLRAVLESWRGRQFTAEELEGFDLKNVLGKGCLVNLVESEDFINVSAVTAPPAGVAIPAAENPLLHFSLDEFDEGTFKKLPEWLANKVKASPEYAELHGQSAGGHPSVAEMDDDIIF